MIEVGSAVRTIRTEIGPHSGPSNLITKLSG